MTPKQLKNIVDNASKMFTLLQGIPQTIKYADELDKAGLVDYAHIKALRAIGNKSQKLVDEIMEFDKIQL